MAMPSSSTYDSTSIDTAPALGPRPTRAEEIAHTGERDPAYRRRWVPQSRRGQSPRWRPKAVAAHRQGEQQDPDD
jgi:hypothetical protein